MTAAVLLVAFGGPEGPDEVMGFLRRVTRGRGVPDERLAEVAEQYALFGGRSPINGHSRALRSAIETELAARGAPLKVYWGNRNAAPFIADTVAEMVRDGITDVVAFAPSAYSSYSGCRQYREDIEGAIAALDDPSSIRIDKIAPFWNLGGFLEPFVDSTAAAIDRIPADRRPTTRILFTAHSIPTSMAENCAYSDQLADAAQLVSERAQEGSEPIPHEVVFQSRSGPPQVPWLEPDVGDRIEELAAVGVTDAVVVPIGFCSDHMEVLYDLDTLAAQRAEEAGIAMHRVATPGTDPRFISMVADLIAEMRGDATPVREGELRLADDHCSATCCPAPVRRPQR